MLVIGGMQKESSIEREKLKQELIQRIGPWAFQSYPREQWNALPDKEIVEGALLRGKPEDKFLLLEIYDIDFINLSG